MLFISGSQVLGLPHVDAAVGAAPERIDMYAQGSLHNKRHVSRHPRVKHANMQTAYM